MTVQKRPISPLWPATVATAPEVPASLELADYVAAATRENTRRSYASAVQHFEHTWGGFLPASSEQVAQYLVAHAETLAFNTLKQRLAALAHWHQQHGFYDPTRSNTVRQVLKGIKTLHPSRERRAKPLHLKDLAQAMDWLTRAAELAHAHGDRAEELRHVRDRALIALGFWRGFRGDELLRLRVEHLEVVDGQGLQCFLPQTKGDRALQGVTFEVPALSVCCPVVAIQAWLAMAHLMKGPLFRRVGRWGEIGEAPLHSNSIIRLLRQILQAAGIADPGAYSAHSLRRGFAAWATADGWDIKALMEYVGWKDLKSAMRYLPQRDPFSHERLEHALKHEPHAPVLTVAVPAKGPTSHTSQASRRGTRLHVEIHLASARAGQRGRGSAERARRHIETVCLASYGAQRLDAIGSRYEIVIGHSLDELIEEHIGELLETLHRAAEQHHCALEAVIIDPQTRERWD